MTESAHAVLLGGAAIGTLIQRGDVARFVFSEDYWTSQHRDVLGLWFEDNPRQSPQAALRLPPWFSNLLPEGPLRQWIARDRGVSVDRELQLLLRIGDDLPGAIQVIQDAGDHGRIDSMGDFAETRAERRVAHASPWKFSLAGVSMKFSMLRSGDRLTIPAQNALGDWIVKFPDSAFPQVPANEFSIMRLASQLGIDVPDIDLVHRDLLPDVPGVVWPSGEEYAYAIRRFDRAENGARVHIEDFAQVRGFYPDDRYSGSLETVAALVFRGRDHASLREFIRRTAYNLLVGNGDAHLKNWSLVYPDGRIPTLAPAYDLVCTGAYFAASDPENIGLRFGRTRSFDRITRAAFTALQTKLGVTDEDVLEVVDSTTESFFMHWRDGAPAELPPFAKDWITPHAEAMRSQIAR